MPSVLIKDIPKELHRQLQRRAKQNRRSMNQETIHLLEAAVSGKTARLAELPPPLPTRRKLTDAWLKKAIRRNRA